jgi:hypothetical protein
VKQAHALSAEERTLLPDDAFALVLLDSGHTLRKYACTDAGNTTLSVLYFLENGHKLPESAQKVAAANLATACSWYGLEAPILEKIALVGWAARQAIKHPFTALSIATSGSTLGQTANTVKANERAIAAIRESEGNLIGGRPISPAEIDEARFGKDAEVSGTALAPMSKAPRTLPTKATVLKSAAMQPHVDVTGEEPVKQATVVTPVRYALGTKYPLDTYEQVKKASAYFDEYSVRFTPEDRREYCLNLLARADELNIKVSAAVERYGATEFAPDEDIKVACDLRKNLLRTDAFKHVLEGLYEKRAELGPELFAATLAEFDKVAGLAQEYDHNIPDPYYSTFAKTAAAAGAFSEVIGNDTITEDMIRAVARLGYRMLKDYFGDEFTEEFKNDPVGIFKSLPRDQKILIMRLASDLNSPGTALQA